MNIAIVSPFNPENVKDLLDTPEEVSPINVVATSVHTMVRGLNKLGHNITVITSSINATSGVTLYSGKGLTIYVIQNKPKTRLWGLNTYPRIRKILSEHLDEFDVLHAQWTYEYAYSIIPFAKLKPCFCSVRDWCPYLMSYTRTLKGKIQMQILNFYFRNVMKCNDIHKVANSLYTYKRISRYLHRNDIPQIYNPVGSEILASNPSKKDTSVTFISIAQRLSDKRKNICTLIKAFSEIHKQNHSTFLKLVGEGTKEEFSYLEKEGYSFSGIFFLGKMSHCKVIQEIECSSILVHPAFEETFGNILLEAGAKFIPCIGGYDAGAVPQVLDYGRAGCLCDVSDMNSLKEAMTIVMSDKNYYQYLANNMYNRIRTNYLDIVVCEKLLKMYQEGIIRGDSAKYS